MISYLVDIHMYRISSRSDTVATIYFTGCFVWLLFKGGYYSRVATILGWLLFEGGYYSRVASIRGWLLFEGGYYSRAATIRGWLLFEGSVYSKKYSNLRLWASHISVC